MGGNGSYSKEMRRIPTEKQTHFSLEDFTIGGHKILVDIMTPTRANIPMNCNTSDRIYIIAAVEKKTNEVKISSIAMYKGHHISQTIDFEYDTDGNIIPYADSGGKSSHLHQWFELRPGIWGRNAHDKTNRFPYELDERMARQIVAFNNKHYHYDELKKHSKS